MGCGLSTLCRDKTQPFINDIALAGEPLTPGAVPLEDIDDANFLRLRKQCPRFRVLIIGKANAGKTTILQKICNTTDKPMIHDEDGNPIDQSVVQPTGGRGIHDINNELTFSSNPHFVFHDSAGFEAAAVMEVENVREFIVKRTATGALQDQLHAIWYCLPLDNDRPLCDAEMSFFERGTGRTPVIAIFTKFDGLILKEYNRLRFEEQLSKQEARERAPGIADKVFKESGFYLKRLQDVPYPPARSIRVEDMHRPDTDCAELSRQTLEALDNKTLQLLFVSVQQNNLGLSTEFAIKEVLLPALTNAINQPIIPSAMTKMALNILACYRHMLWGDDYSNDDPRGMGLQERVSDTHYTAQHAEIMDPTVLLWVTQDSPPLVVLSIGIATIILAEDTFWLQNPRIYDPAAQHLKNALASYQSTNKHPAVIKELSERFGEASLPDLVTNKEVFVKALQEVIQKFRAHI